MGEIDAIETLIDTLVGYDLDDLDQFNLALTARTAISTAITAYTDNDINALTEVEAEAEIKNGIDCIQKLIAKQTADDLKRHNK